ncbi:hypothetical protein M2336_001763 [Sphingobium sp. B1D7B]|uniref:hypothetical protein n=1 Tax=Sphingobium sp. B1D7B TaxID=2940578 RepID=UPI00222413EF|nr:hypothetical protein [Sphingobium sp. B1D7B]MCW2405134.1 hypothetical protein [Sphingobium sp. B1D7B]
MSEVYPLPRSALLFMAAVDEAKRTNEGPFRAIAPIFRISLEGQRGQMLNVEKAASVLNPILGDSFNEHALEAFIPQLCHLGWLVEQKADGTASAYLVPKELPSFDEVEAIETSATKLNRLHAAFEEFLDVHAPLLKITLGKDQFEWQLFKWATSLDGSDKERVKAEAKRLLDGEKLSIRNQFLDETTRLSRIDKQLTVEFAGFVKWLAKHRRPEFADIASLTELGLALEFLEELQRPTGGSLVKIKTTFVLDAPVLLDLLGLSGPSRQFSIMQCLKALREHGSKIVTMSHCLAELADILSAVLDRAPTRRFGLTGDALRADPSLVAHANSVRRQPDKAVKLADVQILNFDRRSPLYASAFPDELIDKFRGSAHWHDMYKTDQRDCDAMSIGYVMRRRNGEIASDYFDTSFLLVTRNSTFTQFSTMFARSNLGIPNYAAGPAIETKTLAAMVWMRFGSAANPDLPQLHLVSACDRILASNRELLRKAEKRLETLKDTEAASVLLSSQQAVLDLVISTGGAPEVLDAANGEELLAAFTTSAEARGRDSERARSDAVRVELEAALATKDRDTEALKAKSVELAAAETKEQARRRQAEELIQKLKEDDDIRIAGIADLIQRKATNRARHYVLAMTVICTAISLGGQFFIWQGSAWWYHSATNFLAGSVVIVCSGLAAALGMHLIPPGHLDLADNLQNKIRRRSALMRLKHVHPVPDRNRVHERLEREEVV